jgi:hypothetical protein
MWQETVDAVGRGLEALLAGHRDPRLRIDADHPTGRIHSLRSALYKRSVPMFPDPISAAFTLAAICTPLSYGADAVREALINAMRCKSPRIYIECVVPAIVRYE